MYVKIIASRVGLEINCVNKLVFHVATRTRGRSMGGRQSISQVRPVFSRYSKGNEPFGLYEVPRYLISGDEYLMVEFGDRLNIVVNCKAIAFADLLQQSKDLGVLEICVGQLSVLVHYDSLVMSLERLIENLKAVTEKLPVIDEMILPSRVIEVPVVFHDRWSQECTEDYSRTIKPMEDNCEVLVKYNGLRDLDDLIEHTCAPEHWITNLGWMPGNANGFPLDPRYEIRAPKYNPSRTWTYEGTLGVGTGDKVIYPLRSAGGYQMIGRTPIKVYDPKRRNIAFRDSFILPGVSDRWKFYSITEEKYHDIIATVDERYRYRIRTTGLFSVKRYLNFLRDVTKEAEEIRKSRPWAN